MELGYFTMPSHPPERSLKAGFEWDLAVLRKLDELGFSEAWIGEHHTAPWEPNPAPDLLIAQALLQTQRIRLAPGGFLPLSLNLNPAYLSSHWQAVEAGAVSAGRRANRADWRTVREVFVADTDAQAWRLAVHGGLGRMMRDYGLQLNRAASLFKYMKHDPAVPDSDVTVEYCARHNWVIGSPATVAARLEEIHHQIGGFGTLLVMGFDYADQPGPWMRSLELLAAEVKPRLAHLRVPPI